MRHPIRITKMSGSGNDFIVLDAEAWESLPPDRADWVRAACRRGLSVGADGVLVVGPRERDGIRVMFFNPDGGEAFCGNGTRCAARYAVARGLDAGPRLQLATSVGPVEATQEGDKISLVLRPPEDRGEIALHGPDADYRGRFVLAGVPHVVLPVQGIETWPLARIAPILRNDPSLGPDGANVNVVASDAAGRIRVRTWERGVEGETLACGTGAVAVAFAARLAGAPERVTILPASGIPLTVDLPGDPAHPRVAVLTGDARFIFEGELAPDGIVSP